MSHCKMPHALEVCHSINLLPPPCRRIAFDADDGSFEYNLTGLKSSFIGRRLCHNDEYGTIVGVLANGYYSVRYDNSDEVRQLDAGEVDAHVLPSKLGHGKNIIGSSVHVATLGDGIIEDFSPEESVYTVRVGDEAISVWLPSDAVQLVCVFSLINVV